MGLQMMNLKNLGCASREVAERKLAPVSLAFHVSPGTTELRHLCLLLYYRSSTRNLRHGFLDDNFVVLLTLSVNIVLTM